MLKLVSFLWWLLFPDALLGPVYMTIHIEVCFIFVHHSAQKIIIVNCIQHQIYKVSCFLLICIMLVFWISVSCRGDRDKEKKVFFFSLSRQDIATLPLQCMVVAALSSGKARFRHASFTVHGSSCTVLGEGKI